MKMLQADTQALRQRLGDQAKIAGRHLWGAGGSASLADLVRGTSLGGRLNELRGRSVLIATTDQLTAALALIELDGIARRLVICPPDVPRQHLSAIAANAEVDALVTDREAGDHAALGIPLHVVCAPGIEETADLAGGYRHTEWLLLTSGTTGVPKMVRHDVATLTAPIRPGADAPVWGTFYDIRRYGGLQIFFRAVVGNGSLILSSAGEPVVDHLARLAAHGVTHISGTPSHWRRVLMSSAARAISPRYVRLSGEIADQAILDNLRATYPQAGVGHAYASTEAGVGFEVNDGFEGFPASFIDARNGDVELTIRDGSLHIRSARTASGYVGNGATALLDEDGFVDTGDMVALRGARYHFVGRKGGIINVGGQKVHPEEIEATINRHPGVWASLVRPRRNPITGAIVVADVVLKEGAAPGEADHRIAAIEHEILDLCRRDLARYKVPAMIRFVSALDVSPTGKLVRHA
jgi:acyl-coenzyme A synthetase/AMP-(fatty) acid ligase